MKRLLLLLLWVSAGLQAQIVNIPDPVFMTKVLQLGIDTNGDGTINEAEAAAYTGNINLSNSALASLEGIQFFTHLHKLIAGYTNLASVDLHDLPDLTGLELDHNVALTSLHLANLPYLTDVQIAYTSLTDLQIDGLPRLNQLNAKNVISSGFTVDFSGQTWVYSTALFFDYSSITSLNVDGSRVYKVSADHSALEAIHASDTPYMTEIFCPSSQLSNLQIANSAVTSIDVTNNYLSSLDLSGLASLMTLDVSYCELVGLNLHGCTHLLNISARNNQLATLDVSECQELNGLNVENNPLVTLFARNGSNENILVSTSSLQYVCVDEIQWASVSNMVGPGVVVSPYCLLTPGGNFNDLSGSITFDLDNDGCDAQDPGMSYTAMTVTSGSSTYTSFSVTEGDYLSYVTGTGTYLIQPALENPSFFTVTPPLSQLSLAGTTTATNLDFCITPNGIHHDVEVTIVPVSAVVPGLNTYYSITYRNKGNQVENGQVSFQYDDDKLDLVSTSQVPANSAIGSLSWNFTGLLPYESRTIYVTLNANSPIETPPVNIGDIMVYNSSIMLLQPDENPNDNAVSFNHTVVGAYDPNDITCLEGNIVNTSLIGQYLHYDVNFENTGNYPAANVVVRMVMDAATFDLPSLQVMGSSHYPRVRRGGNVVEFIFEGIQLPANGKGNVLFKIKTKNILVAGSSVSQKADIYFDFNAPVATNTATTTFQQLGTQTLQEESFVLWPNPASNLITISGANDIETISLFNLLGQEVARQKGNGRGTQVDLSSLPAGNYLVRVKAVGGEQLMKLVKK